MFSEENIERTIEELVEYVEDNAHLFTRKYDKNKGQYSNHWSFNTGELPVKIIEDAMEVLGAIPAIDIITKTLNDIHGFSSDDEYNEEAMKSIVETNAESENEDENNNEEVSDKDMVNHPSHYNQGKFETIDIIEDIVRGYQNPEEAYLIGTVVKYLSRAPFKNAKKQDLEKAEFYLKRLISKQ